MSPSQRHDHGGCQPIAGCGRVSTVGGVPAFGKAPQVPQLHMRSGCAICQYVSACDCCAGWHCGYWADKWRCQACCGRCVMLRTRPSCSVSSLTKTWPPHTRWHLTNDG